MTYIIASDQEKESPINHIFPTLYVSDIKKDRRVQRWVYGYVEDIFSRDCDRWTKELCMSAKLISAMEKKTCSRIQKIDGTVMLILYQDLTKI